MDMKNSTGAAMNTKQARTAIKVIPVSMYELLKFNIATGATTSNKVAVEASIESKEIFFRITDERLGPN
jgi:hypothetical protein